MAAKGPSPLRRAWLWIRQDRLHETIGVLGGVAALLLVVLVVMIALRGGGQATGPLIPRTSVEASATESPSASESPSPSARPSSTAANNNTAQSVPPARTEAGLAYDGDTRTSVLFGGLQGQDPSGQLNDTWTWDGRTWTEQHPGQSPPAANYPVMAYDAAHKDVLLLDHGQTWTWNGSAWNQASPSQTPANSANGDVMAYDTALGKIVLFGGSAGNETWSWDGASWTPLQPPTSPSPRLQPGLTYDDAHGQLVLFGGKDALNAGNEFNDTWTFDGTTWLPHTGLSSPPSRYDPVMAYDASRRVVILFAGRSDAANTTYNATWSWDGLMWRRLSPTTAPQPLAGRAGTYDGAYAQIVVFGGSGADLVGDVSETWTWDGSTWTRRT